MFNVWGVVSIALFYVIILVIGIWASRKAKRKSAEAGKTEEENMIVAGRNLHPCLSVFSMIATAVCGAYLTGIAEVISTPTSAGGLLWCLIPLGTFAGVVSCFVIAKPLRSGEYLTMIEPFQKHYGNGVGALFALISIFSEIMWTAGVLNAFGATISVVMDADNTLAVIVSSCIVVFYTLLGGLYAVAYTDVVQIICVFFGLWACVPFALTHPSVVDIRLTAVVGPQSANSTANANSTRGWLGQVDVTDVGLWIDQALMVVLGGIPWSSCLQRLLACRSARQAQAVCLITSAAFLTFAFPAVIIGAVAASTAWEETEYNRTLTAENAGLALPLALQYLTPTPIAFVGLGALSAAVMSSADSTILASGSLFSQNIYKSLIRRTTSKRETMWVMRVTMVVAGVLATALALTSKGVYFMYLVATELAYIVLFPHLVLVLQCKEQLNVFGCVLSLVSGMTLRFLLGESAFDIPAIVKLPLYDEERQMQLLPTKTICMLVTLLTVLVASFLWKCATKLVKKSRNKNHKNRSGSIEYKSNSVEKGELLVKNA